MSNTEIDLELRESMMNELSNRLLAEKRQFTFNGTMIEINDSYEYYVFQIEFKPEYNKFSVFRRHMEEESYSSGMYDNFETVEEVIDNC